MSENNNEKLGLTGEDVKQKDEGPGIAGLFAAMGDRDADAAAIAASEDGMLIGQRMSLMGMPEGSEEGKAYWTGYERACARKSTAKVWKNGPPMCPLPQKPILTADSP